MTALLPCIVLSRKRRMLTDKGSLFQPYDIAPMRKEQGLAQTAESLHKLRLQSACGSFNDDEKELLKQQQAVLIKVIPE